MGVSPTNLDGGGHLPTFEPHRRKPQVASQERKRAEATLKPFLMELKAWNNKVTRIRGRSDSIYSTDQDRHLAHLECGALLAEIRHRHDAFRLAIKAERPHSRFEDIEAAFHRLADQLQSMSDVRPR
ncbi:MAG: hypothetical protein JWQ89_2305 [Devosia sp.]|nr:hypothetical protein [Devosia sp.]